MKMRDFFSDIKLWIGLVIFFVMVGVSFATWIKLPAKVEKIEKEQVETKDKVQNVAQTVDIYIKVSAEKEKAQEKRDLEKEKSAKEEKELMYKWIAEVSRK